MPKIFLKSVASSIPPTSVPINAPSKASADGKNRLFSDTLLSFRFIVSAAAAEKTKNRRFIPLACIGSTPSMTVSQITKSPPLPMPSPESTAIKNDMMTAAINEISTFTSYLTIIRIPDQMTKAENNLTIHLDLILFRSKPPAMPPSSAGIAKTEKLVVSSLP